MRSSTTRRRFLKGSGVLLAATAVSGSLSLLAQEKSQSDKAKESADKAEEVSPAEDLMREHGVLDWVLLIYGEVLIRLHEGRTAPPEALASGADLVHRFIEDYHEKLEEEYLFPRFEKAGKLVELVQVLRQQHQAGRRLTEAIKNRATTALRHNVNDQKAVVEAMHSLFVCIDPMRRAKTRCCSLRSAPSSRRTNTMH